MKTLHDIAKSRFYREKTLEYLGMVPESILKHDRGDRPIDSNLVADGSGADYKTKTEAVAKKLLPRIDPNAVKHFDLFRSSSTGCRGKEGILSTFSQNICRFMVRFYTEEGGKVFDPFAGHNSRMEAVWRSGRHYYGSDISHSFMEFNFKLKELLLNQKDEELFATNNTEIYLHEGDSKKVPWEDNFADFSITSPPYWDLEYYGPEDGQLGYGGGKVTYEMFLEGLGEVLAENYRVLKPGAFCAWNVNDFRKGGRFYEYHVDLALLGRKVGFIPHDMIIFDYGTPVASAFLTQMISRKVMAKRHEFCLVWRKPGGEKLIGISTSEIADRMRQEMAAKGDIPASEIEDIVGEE